MITGRLGCALLPRTARRVLFVQGRLWLGSGWICHPWVCELQDGRRVPDVLALALKSVPGPSRDGQALGDVVSRLVVARHGRRGGPGEIVVQHLPEWPGRA